MAVEDEEPLTRQEQSEGGGGGARQPGAPASIETILTSALHKHAARKLGKKLSKSKKSNLKTKEEPQEDNIKKKKRAKSIVAKASETQEELELTAVKESGGAENSRREETITKEHRGSASDTQTLAEDGRKKTRGESEGEGDEEAMFSAGEEEEEAAISPTRAYLKAVSVPKKKLVRKRKKTIQDNGRVLAITIHSADRLEGSLLLFPHPVVQVYICNMDSGQLLQKSSPDRKVTSYYERSEVDYILPIMTNPFDIKKARYPGGGRSDVWLKLIIDTLKLHI